MIGLGAPMLIVGLVSESDPSADICIGDDCVMFDIDLDTGGVGYGVAAAGGGLMVVGALLATVWSDVPVVNNLEVQVTPQRLQVGKAFGF